MDPEAMSVLRVKKIKLTTKPNKKSGFTLIEVLLAISIFSLLMLTALFAYNFMQQNWQRNQQRQFLATQHYQQWQLLYDVLVNTYPKAVFKQPIARQTPSIDDAGFYFLGKEDGYTAVTASSMQNPASAAVYRLFKEPDATNPALWQLVYEEALLTEQLLSHAGQALPFNFRRILLQGQQHIRLSYQGYLSVLQRFEQQEAGEASQAAPWHTQYDAMQTQLHPETWELISDNWQWRQPLQDTANTQLVQLDDGQ